MKIRYNVMTKKKKEHDQPAILFSHTEKKSEKSAKMNRKTTERQT
jgi:hypothetical protein